MRTMNQSAVGKRRVASSRLHLMRPTLSVGPERAMQSNGLGLESTTTRQQQFAWKEARKGRLTTMGGLIN
jgi:hypothetical protein